MFGAEGAVSSTFSMRRAVSAANLPDAFVANPLGAAAGEDHDAAKAGDVPAAVRLAQRLVTPALLDCLRKSVPLGVIVAGVSSVELSGLNALPGTAAVLIADRLGLAIDASMVQANRPQRTALGGLDRVFQQPEFSGEVEAGRGYVLVDDTLTQGGTLAALASHIEQNGGHVAAIVALTGRQYSRALVPGITVLQRLRNRFGDMENAFRQATGYGFDGLTASEARYLANFNPADAVRNRILAAAQEGRHRAGQSDPGRGSGSRAASR